MGMRTTVEGLADEAEAQLRYHVWDLVVSDRALTNSGPTGSSGWSTPTTLQRLGPEPETVAWRSAPEPTGTPRCCAGAVA